MITEGDCLATIRIFQCMVTLQGKPLKQQNIHIKSQRGRKHNKALLGSCEIIPVIQDISTELTPAVPRLPTTRLHKSRTKK